jgi:hypothetical protein
MCAFFAIHFLKGFLRNFSQTFDSSLTDRQVNHSAEPSSQDEFAATKYEIVRDDDELNSHLCIDTIIHLFEHIKEQEIQPHMDFLVNIIFFI